VREHGRDLERADDAAPRDLRGALAGDVLPLNRIVPVVGSRNFVSRLKQVVLPAPLGPMSAWIEPRTTERLTLLTAVNPLNSLVSWRVSRMTSLISRGRPGSEKKVGHAVHLGAPP
jgi:hypothetical protein